MLVQLLLIALCFHFEILGFQDLSHRVDILVNECNEIGWHIASAVVLTSFDRTLTFLGALVDNVEPNAGNSDVLPAGHRANRIGLRMD